MACKGQGSNPLSSTRHKAGRWWRITRLPMEHRAGQGTGDAVHDLDAGDHQPAQLIQSGRLHPGDDVIGPTRSSANCTPSRSLSAWATWATLPTSVWMSTYALSAALTSSTSDRANALTWQMAPRRSMMPRKARAVDEVAPEY
jgi:hypothetical protein